MEGKKKKKLILVGISVFLLLLLVGVSYALWQFTYIQKDENTVTSDCFEVEFEEDTTSTINLTKAYPMSEREGMNLKPYTFRLKNICSSASNYQINMEMMEGSTMPDQVMRTKLNEQTSVLLTNSVDPSVGKRAYKIGEGVLYPNEIREFSLRIWMDEKTSIEDNATEKTFKGKISIVASYQMRYTENILNGTDPVLANGLIPVTIENDGSVKKADIAKEWYNYANREWANAVILEDESIIYQNEEMIPEDNIESYFVWIPKYRYKLWDLGEYETLSESVEDKTQTIDVIFGDYDTVDKVGECKTPGVSGESGNCKVGDYMTHPAFQAFGTKGLWVGKFETGYKEATSVAAAQVNNYNPEKVEVKPNVYSWRNINVANAHLNSYNYKRENDSHMMKNTEWGAVAYLQHSIYGSRESVRMNNNSGYITGYSATSEPTCGYISESKECLSYEETILNEDGEYTKRYNTEVGYLASTTRNITGVYGMNGITEYTMGVMVSNDNVTPCAGRDKSNTSGFSGPYCNTEEFASGVDLPDKKYYDMYAYSTSNLNYNRRILGDATAELGPFSRITPFEALPNPSGSWYTGISTYFYTMYPWIGRFSIFSFSASRAMPSNFTGYRIVLAV